MKNIFGKLYQITTPRLWITLFIGASLIAFLVQLIILSYIFPSWNGGHGLLVGMDSLSFHRIASELANKINNQGWSNWEFRPSGQSVAGIMGVAYALTGIQEPWIIIPIYTVLYATGGILLWLIIDFFLKNRQKSLLCLTPYIFLPSAIMLYAQPHKDMWQIIGFFCFIYGWCLLFRQTTWKNLSLVIKVFFIILFGAGLSWIVRPYCVQIMQIMASLFSLFLTFFWICLVFRKKLKWTKSLLFIFLIWILVAAFTPIASISATVSKLNNIGLLIQKTNPSSAISIHLKSLSKVNNFLSTTTKPSDLSSSVNSKWIKTSWLPSFIDQKLASIALNRDGFCLTNGNGNLDENISFCSVRDIVSYLPRAAEIGFLSPFPYQWFEIGSTSYNTLFRRIAGIEMVIIYTGELLLLWGITKFWRKPEIWIIFISSVAMIMAYALVVINIGTLYRERWGYMILLASLGFAMFLKYWNQKQNKAV